MNVVFLIFTLLFLGQINFSSPTFAQQSYKEYRAKQREKQRSKVDQKQEENRIKQEIEHAEMVREIKEEQEKLLKADKEQKRLQQMKRFQATRLGRYHKIEDLEKLDQEFRDYFEKPEAFTDEKIEKFRNMLLDLVVKTFFSIEDEMMQKNGWGNTPLPPDALGNSLLIVYNFWTRKGLKTFEPQFKSLYENNQMLYEIPFLQTLLTQEIRRSLGEKQLGTAFYARIPRDMTPIEIIKKYANKSPKELFSAYLEGIKGKSEVNAINQVPELDTMEPKSSKFKILSLLLIGLLVFLLYQLYRLFTQR